MSTVDNVLMIRFNITKVSVKRMILNVVFIVFTSRIYSVLRFSKHLCDYENEVVYCLSC